MPPTTFLETSNVSGSFDTASERGGPLRIYLTVNHTSPTSGRLDNIGVHGIAQDILLFCILAVVAYGVWVLSYGDHKI